MTLKGRPDQGAALFSFPGLGFWSSPPGRGICPSEKGQALREGLRAVAIPGAPLGKGHCPSGKGRGLGEDLEPSPIPGRPSGKGQRLGEGFRAVAIPGRPSGRGICPSGKGPVCAKASGPSRSRGAPPREDICPSGKARAPWVLAVLGFPLREGPANGTGGSRSLEFGPGERVAGADPSSGALRSPSR